MELNAYEVGVSSETWFVFVFFYFSIIFLLFFYHFPFIFLLNLFYNHFWMGNTLQSLQPSQFFSQNPTHSTKKEESSEKLPAISQFIAKLSEQLKSETRINKEQWASHLGFKLAFNYSTNALLNNLHTHTCSKTFLTP